MKTEGIALPKPLVPVEGVPLIERLLHSLIRAGITDVVCIINEQSMAVRDHVGRLSLPIPVHWVVKSTPSSMHSLFEISPYFTEEHFLLTTVDPIFRAEEFSRFVRCGQQPPGADGVLAVTPFVDDENPLYVSVDEEGTIRGFSKTDRSPLVTGGLYILSPRIFRERDACLARGMQRLRHFLEHLVASGYRLSTFTFSKIVDVDHLQDIRVAEKLLREA